MNYFRPSHAPRAAAAALTFPFDPSDPQDTAIAYDAARLAAREVPGGHVVAWRRPKLPGPWAQVTVVGEPTFGCSA